MALTKTSANTSNIQDLSDKPNEIEGLTSDQLKKKFDDYAIDNKTYINEVLTEELDTSLTIASEAEAIAGTEAVKKMTPQRTKQAIDNTLLISNSGWTLVSVSWAYASASTITVPSGAASLYAKGDKLRFKQGAGYKYYYIVGVADTVLTVTGGSDYTVANSAITDIYYSHQLSPIGFPNVFNFTGVVSTTGGTITTATNPITFVINGTNLTLEGLVTIVNKGTGSGVLKSTIPVASIANAIGNGRNTSDGTIISVAIYSSIIYFYDMSIADGQVSLYSLSYKI